MADESDYTQMWSGVFTPPRIGDDDGGVYLLEEAAAQPPRREKATAAGDRHLAEGFQNPAAGGGRGYARYAQGSSAYGRPGFRGVTSSRAQRRAVDDVAWDNRPLHFAPGAGAEHAHLHHDPRARGPPLFVKHPGGTDLPQIDKFSGSPPAAGKAAIAGLNPAEAVRLILLATLVVLAGLILSRQAAEQRERREIMILALGFRAFR